MKKISAILIATVLFGLTFSRVSAATTEVETVCETSSYGEQTCRTTTSTEEENKYVRVLGATQEHYPMADTALDLPGTIALFSVLIAGGVLAFNKLKKLA